MSERANPPGLASVIVPCSGQLDLTRRCVAALARHTRWPWELVAVDVGPDGDTAAYLAGVKDAAPFRVEAVAGPDGRDFPGACERGLRAARGDSLVLLRGDAVVTVTKPVKLGVSEPESLRA